jgi:hypothetical protein
MEYSEFEDYGSVSEPESEQEGEACQDYYPGMLSDRLNELNEARGRQLEEQLLGGC